MRSWYGRFLGALRGSFRRAPMQQSPLRPPCMRASSHSLLSSLSLMSSVSPCSHPQKHKHATDSAGPVRKALVHSEVARQHAAHEMLRVEQWLGLKVDVEIPRQMEEPAALGSHFRAQEAHPLLRVPVLPSCAAGSNFCLHQPRVALYFVCLCGCASLNARVRSRLYSPQWAHLDLHRVVVAFRNSSQHEPVPSVSVPSLREYPAVGTSSVQKPVSRVYPRTHPHHTHAYAGRTTHAPSW